MKRNIKSLFLKARYLNEEYKETKELFDKHYIEFFKELDIFIKENNIEGITVKLPDENKESAAVQVFEDKPPDDETVKDAEDIPVEPKNAASEELKKLYRKIAIITHPDKHPKHISEDKRREMIDIYNKSTEAMSNGDVFSILDAASKLYIDLPEVGGNELDSIRDKCLAFENDIKTMKNTYIWAWSLSDEQGKQNCLISFLNNNLGNKL